MRTSSYISEICATSALPPTPTTSSHRTFRQLRERPKVQRASAVDTAPPQKVRDEPPRMCAMGIQQEARASDKDRGTKFTYTRYAIRVLPVFEDVFTEMERLKGCSFESLLFAPKVARKRPSRACGISVRNRPRERLFRSSLAELQTEKDSMAERSEFELVVPLTSRE
jgi:hypothetical protein